MPPPPFGVLTLAGQLSQGPGEFVHRRDVAVHPLSLVQPVALASVAGKRLALPFLYSRRVHERLRNDAAAEGIAQTVRAGVIEGDSGLNRVAWRHAPVA